MGDLTAWIIIGAMVVVIVCLFSLSNQIHGNLQIMLQIMDSNQKSLLDRLRQMSPRETDAPAASAWEGIDRRIGPRRGTQVTGGYHNGERRNPGRSRRREDMVASGAADMQSAD